MRLAANAEAKGREVFIWRRRELRVRELGQQQGLEPVWGLRPPAWALEPGLLGLVSAPELQPEVPEWALERVQAPAWVLESQQELRE